jgi:signal transduction histidine kinase
VPADDEGTVETTIERDSAECRRLAELLHLDAVGIARGGDARRIAWWARPGSPALPLAIDDVVEGRVDGWVVTVRRSDVVFGRLAPGSSPQTEPALRALLESLALADDAVAPRPGRGAPPKDTLARDRTRWAYAIHDGLTQVVTAAVLDLEWLARKAEFEPARAVEALDDAARELRKALDEIRGMLAVVTPDEPQDANEGIDELVRMVAARWQLPADWSIEGDLRSVPRPVLEAASSVIREGVANAAKHSSSRDVAVRVHASPQEMEISIEDRGRGFRPEDRGLHAGHLGLEMMRRRVAEVRGTLDIQSEPGRGTRVVARLPVGKGDTP